MKFSAATLALSLASASAFAPSASFVRKSSSLNMGFDLTGNNWKPDSEKMGSTDTGDYFPEDYEADIDFTAGMKGSQETMAGGSREGPQLPGLEGLGDDAIMMGGIEQSTEIPVGMEFIPSSVPDGEYEFNVASTGPGDVLTIAVKPVCMTFEDYFAAFSKDSHPSFSVGPVTGRMDRARGGEPTYLDIMCKPDGAGGELKGDLVIMLPEDNSKICFKITAKSL